MSFTKKYQGFSSSDWRRKKNSQFNYFVLPTPVSLPQFPIPKDLTPVVMKNLQPFPGMTEKSIQFMKVLEKIRSVDGLEIKESNHLQILKIMLYVEEIQNNLDMRIYDQEKKNIVRISKVSELFKIYVDGLMEERPSVRPNDMVEIRDSASKVLYLLRVTNVMNDHLIAVGGARFCNQYNPEKLYNIRFRFQNYPLRCCHYALSLIKLYELTPLFFPIKRPTFNKPSSNEHWFNKNIESNPEQKQAVLNIACKSSYPAPYILYGPPGTGKTATLVEAICQVWLDHPSEHILVCTPSNTAADVITKRLLAYDIPEHNLYRMYSPSKEGSHIDEDIISCSNYVDGQIMMLPKELVFQKQIVICTLCACTRLKFLDFREKHFSYVFIDEAGQATEPETMIPYTLLSSTREGRIGRLHSQVILAGDPKQLGPGVRSKLAEPILGKSMLERMMDCEPYQKNEHDKYNPSYITKLIRNYRSHPKIIQVSNEQFYDNELLACGDDKNIRKAEYWQHLAQPKFPIIFHGVTGIEEKDKRSPSVYNIDEIRVVLHYVKLLMNNGFNKRAVRQNDIAIITPFATQRVKLHRALEEQQYNDIDVGTVELFQGQERDVIILSTVRSKTFKHDGREHIGFLSNPKRFNVALTRAKALLIVVGNPKILQKDPNWHHLLNFCVQHNAYRGVSFKMPVGVENMKKNRAITKKLRDPNISLLNDSNLQVVQLDDGIIDSSDSSMVDENEYPSTSRNTTLINISPAKYNMETISNNPRSEALLSDVVITKLSDLKLKKAEEKAAKKERRKKNKATNTS